MSEPVIMEHIKGTHTYLIYENGKVTIVDHSGGKLK